MKIGGNQVDSWMGESEEDLWLANRGMGRG